MSVWISWFNGMWNTLCLPIAFLLFCASLKYFVGVKINEIEWVDFFAELAIDLLAVLASFIIGRYIVESSTNNVLIGCFAKLAWIAVFMVVLSLIRRKVNHLLQRSELQYFAIGFAVLLEYAFVVVCLFLIF